MVLVLFNDIIVSEWQIVRVWDQKGTDNYLPGEREGGCHEESRNLW
jgi:hypothetical protein